MDVVAPASSSALDSLSEALSASDVDVRRAVRDGGRCAASHRDAPSAHAPAAGNNCSDLSARKTARHDGRRERKKLQRHEKRGEKLQRREWLREARRVKLRMTGVTRARVSSSSFVRLKQQPQHLASESSLQHMRDHEHSPQHSSILHWIYGTVSAQQRCAKVKE